MRQHKPQRNKKKGAAAGIATPQDGIDTHPYLKATFSVAMNARGAPICTKGTLVFSSWPLTLPT